MWGEVEFEPEVEEWFRSLSLDQRNQASFYINLLEDRGTLLGFPYSSQLRGKLRELRFSLDRERWRISDYVASGRRIILLTVFRKRRSSEQGEIARAERAMQRCIAEGHTAEEDDA
jgi:hypothetical protein